MPSSCIILASPATVGLAFFFSILVGEKLDPVSENPNANKNSRIQNACAAIMLLGYAVTCYSSMLNWSATYDEQVYVLAGFSYLETGEYCLKQDAPPLIPLLSGMAVSLYEFNGKPLELSERIVEYLPKIREDWESKSIGSQQEYLMARDFFHDNNGKVLIQYARIPSLGISVLCGVFVYLVSRQNLGGWAALVALGFFVLEPTMLAYGPIIAADMPLACFFAGSHYFLSDLWTRANAQTLRAQLQ